MKIVRLSKEPWKVLEPPPHNEPQSWEANEAW